MVVDGETFTMNKSSGAWGEEYTVRRCGRTGTPIGTLWSPRADREKRRRPGPGVSRYQVGFCVTHSYMPPEMEAMADPDKPEFVYMPEFGHNLHQRRLLMV